MGLHLHHHHHGASDSGMLSELTSSQSAARVRHVVMVGCAVNALLMAAKLLTGYFGHSDALMADGIHSLNDLAADLIMLFFVGISFRKADGRYTYGYGKFETFSSFLISAFLIIVGFLVLYEGIEGVTSFFKGEELPRPDIWTVVVIAFAIVAKECLYRYYSATGRRIGSNALLANAWHHRMDALASIATLVGVSCSHFFGESWRVADPIVTILISIVIIIAAARLFIPSFTELMERSLPARYSVTALEIASKVEGVKEVVSLRSRKSGHYLIFDIGVAVDPHLTVEQGAVIAGAVTRALEQQFGPALLASVSTLPASRTH